MQQRDTVTAHAFSRAGLLGNPSDGYGGKAIALSLYEFRARVTVRAADRFAILPGADDALEFDSLIEASRSFREVGCDDGLRLVRAAVAQRVVSSGGSLTRLADLQPSLEEVYTRYFEEARHAA